MIGPLPEAIAKMTVAPASALGLPLGRIAKGARADITILDPEAEWTVKASDFQSKGRNTPFEGRRLTGKAMVTMVGGEVVYGIA